MVYKDVQQGGAYLKKAILVLNIRRVCDPSPAQGDSEKNKKKTKNKKKQKTKKQKTKKNKKKTKPARWPRAAMWGNLGSS